MAVRKVFSDEENNDLECYLTDQNRLYIGVGQSGEDLVGNGYITLEKEDVKLLIAELTAIEKEMEE